MTNFASSISRVASSRYNSKNGSFWLAAFLLISLIVPVEFSFSIGDIRLSISRLLLLLAAIPIIWKYVRTQEKNNYEFLLFGYVFWLFISLSINHGVAVSIERAGSLGLEIIVTFFIAALVVKNVKQWICVVKIVIFLVAIILPFVIVEAVVGRHFIHEFAASLTGFEYPFSYEHRLGLLRSSGPFNHPILLGVFSATLIGMVWYGIYNGQAVKKIGCIFIVLLNTFLALSSAPMILVMLQAFAILFNKIASAYRFRWRAIAFCVFILYFILLFVSNRSPFMVILSRITLDPSTSYYRLLTWQYGVDSVTSNPLFGVGMNAWARPGWMITSSIDSFWLKTAILYGLPALLMLALATFLLLKKAVKTMSDSRPSLYRKLCVGWLVSMVSLILLGFTVDFFGEIHIYFFFMMGLGASLINMKKEI